jgi:hypothetical protein
VAAILTEAAPGQVYGVSGDEYAIVMPGTSIEQAFLRMEELRCRVVDARERFGLVRA